MAIFYTDDMHAGRARRRRACCVAVLAGPALARRLAADAVRAGRHRAVAGRAGLGRARDAGRRARRPAAAGPAAAPGRRRAHPRRTGGPCARAPDAERARLAALAAARHRARRATGCSTSLHPWTAYVVVPVFGLANAGVSAGRRDAAARRPRRRSPSASRSPWCVGNAIGITAGPTVALRTGLGVLPGGVRWSHLMAGATLAGIGFTISLFITDLAFSDEALREQATIGILGRLS